MTERIARSEAWRQQFIAMNGFRCHYCNRGGGMDTGPDGRPWHVDHMTPLALGGADTDDNLALACKRCNLVKATQPYKTFAEFAKLAYWVRDDGSLSNLELDHLMYLWSKVADSDEPDEAAWRYDAIGTRVFFIAEDGDPETILSLPSDGERYNRDRDETALKLAAEMHRSLPKLVAEIRILRAAVEGAA